MKKSFLLLKPLVGFLWDIKIQRIYLVCVFSILGMLFNACSPGSAGSKPEIRITNERFQTRSDMIITGKNFTPGKSVTITLTNFPKIDGNITGNTTADATGNFTYRKEFAFRTVDRNEEFINILVTGRDETTTQFAIENVSPEPYIIRR